MSYETESRIMAKIRVGIKQAFEETKNESMLPGHLVLLTPDRFSDAMEFLNSQYITDEPCCRAGGQTFTEDLKRLWYLKPFTCEYGMTVLLLKPFTNAIIAIQVIDVETKEVKRSLNHIKDNALKNTIAIKDNVVEKIDIYKMFGIDTTVRFLHLAVEKEYRQSGLASQLIDFCLNVYRKLYISPLYAKVHCSSVYSRRVFEKNGFKVFSSVRYSDYMVDGKIVFINMGEHDSFSLLVTKIS